MGYTSLQNKTGVIQFTRIVHVDDNGGSVCAIRRGE